MRYNQSMKIIAGLGNPGKQYEHNRHNVGFLAINFLIKNLGFKILDFKNWNHSLVLETTNQNIKVLFIKPQTFMNNSGQAIKEITLFYKLNPAKDILVLHDEVDLPFGSIRLTASSSSAGQNGVQNIIDELGTQDFNRLRIGVETRESRAVMGTRDFVLQNFTKAELAKLESEILPQLKSKVEEFIKH